MPPQSTKKPKFEHHNPPRAKPQRKASGSLQSSFLPVASLRTAIKVCTSSYPDSLLPLHDDPQEKRYETRVVFVVQKRNLHFGFSYCHFGLCYVSVPGHYIVNNRRIVTIENAAGSASDSRLADTAPHERTYTSTADANVRPGYCLADTTPHECPHHTSSDTTTDLCSRPGSHDGGACRSSSTAPCGCWFVLRRAWWPRRSERNGVLERYCG